MSPRRLAALRDARGFTLTELLVATGIFLFVMIGLGSLYLSTRRAFDYSSAQVFVQRQGTLIQEDLMRQMLPAVGIQVMTCGPSGASASLMFTMTPEAAAREASATKSRFRCLYQYQDAAAFSDTVPQLYACKLPDNPPTYSDPPPAAGTDCSSGTKQNLLLQSLNYTARPLGAQLGVANTTFTQITAVNGIPVTTASVDLRFDLTDQKSIFTSEANPQGLRFGFVATVRN